ncbi:hypothetical protein CR513_21689, partial [Mucuna pruriens]
MVLPSLEEAVTLFGYKRESILGESITLGRMSSGKDQNEGCEVVGPRPTTKSTFLTFSDPNLKSWRTKQPVYEDCQKGSGKNLTPRKGASPEVEGWFRTAAREKCLRELERDQALLEKEELIAALADARLKEDDARDHLHQLQERITLLEEDVAKGKLHNKHLEKQRRQGLVELTDERRKVADLGLRADAVVQRSRREGGIGGPRRSQVLEG